VNVDGKIIARGHLIYPVRMRHGPDEMDTASQDHSPPTIALLAFPDVTASVLFGLNDMFHSAGRDWGLVVNGRPGAPLFRPVIVAAESSAMTVANGVQIVPDAVFHAVPPPSVLCVPEVFVAPGTPLAGRFEAEIAFIRRCHAAGSIVAAACSGALLLAEAGLLEGEDATTHWAYCDALAARHPRVRVHARRSLVVTGEGHRLVMAGGGTSWHDLALYLVSRLAGLEAAMQLARVYLVDWHDVGQQPYARLSSTRQSDDAVISRCQVWLADNYREPNPVAAMTRVSGLNGRTFVRRFKQATGMSPLEYVHRVRLEEAKQMLEATDLPVAAIALEVGYEDEGFFVRLFKRSVDMTPGQYRRRFAGLRDTLRATSTATKAGAQAA
jgi:transcriptional regulator GlxA family with amidase domain